MRLGGFYSANKESELEAICQNLDKYGLSTIQAPFELANMPDEECEAFGQKAIELGIYIGEAGMWENLMTPNEENRLQNIKKIRVLLQKADLMGCKTVVSLPGSWHPSDNFLAPHPTNYSKKFKNEFKEVVLKILDGLELKTTTYSIEPWHNNFFYQPEEIYEFIQSVDHQAFGLHLDQMNMVSQQNYFNTTELINNTFDLLSEHVCAVHFKDIRIDYEYMFLKYDEVLIGEGVLDYNTLLKRLVTLPEDLPCFCEHLHLEKDYLFNFDRLHKIAQRNGIEFLKRFAK